ncbi:hypothetical protein [Sphingomonas sp.]|uniref:hypothetical protein n=1 Tax=Sphingomonas sp. TaxID=28214 RepID=UPI002DD62C96|nr:hypothetical protein [Sphingomonas sp.]
MKAPALILAATGLLAACSDPLPVANNVSAVEVNGTEDVMPAEGDLAPEVSAANGTNAAGAMMARTDADYVGRWVGVEGMMLNVTAKPGGGVTLDIVWGLDADMKGRFDGSVTAEGLRFMRGGVAETAVHTDGDATGLKWLAGKKDCLTVKPGEGYCRD